MEKVYEVVQCLILVAVVFRTFSLHENDTPLAATTGYSQDGRLATVFDPTYAPTR